MITVVRGGDWTIKKHCGGSVRGQHIPEKKEGAKRGGTQKIREREL